MPSLPHIHRDHERGRITHDLAFEVWQMDSDWQWVIRLRGDAATGYHGPTTSYKTRNILPAHLAELRYARDGDGCADWESIRTGQKDGAKWSLAERYGPEWVVPSLASSERRGFWRVILLIAAVVGFVLYVTQCDSGSSTDPENDGPSVRRIAVRTYRVGLQGSLTEVQSGPRVARSERIPT